MGWLWRRNSLVSIFYRFNVWNFQTSCRYAWMRLNVLPIAETSSDCVYFRSSIQINWTINLEWIANIVCRDEPPATANPSMNSKRICLNGLTSSLMQNIPHHCQPSWDWSAFEMEHSQPEDILHEMLTCRPFNIILVFGLWNPYWLVNWLVPFSLVALLADVIKT